jgi:hypothetical protein
MTKSLPLILVTAFLILMTGCSRLWDDSPPFSGTPTVTPSATEARQNTCQEILTSTSIDLPKEKLILTDGSNLEILYPGTSQVNEFSKSDERISSPIISPQGKWLAYKRNDNLNSPQNDNLGKLILVSSDDKTTKQLEWDKNWESLGYWLDEQNIVIKLFRNPPSTLNPLLLLNINTGVMKTLVSDFPEIEDLTRLEWSSSGKAIYNPSTTEVIYPSLGVEGHAYILWDVQDKEIIASLPTRDFTLDGPHWSPNGSGFAVVATGDNNSLGKNEFYWVNATGTISQITFFRNEYSAIDIRKWSWSPDGQYISYWYKIGDVSTQTYELGILEVTTGRSEYYCLSSLENFLQEPLWTIDSSELVLNITKLNEKENQVILLNIMNRTASIIIRNMYPIGWLVKNGKEY